MISGKFRKRPIQVEAWRYDSPGDRDQLIRVGAALTIEWLDPGEWTSSITYIQTLEGEMRVMIGDWIIKGIRGEFYPCKPDIFEATYEAIE